MSSIIEKPAQARRQTVTEQLETLRESLTDVSGPRQHALSAILTKEMAFVFSPGLGLSQTGTPWFEDGAASQSWAQISRFVQGLAGFAGFSFGQDSALQQLAVRVFAGPCMARAYAFWTPDDWKSLQGLVIVDTNRVFEVCRASSAVDHGLKMTHFNAIGIPFQKLGQFTGTAASPKIFDLDIA